MAALWRNRPLSIGSALVTLIAVAISVYLFLPFGVSAAGLLAEAQSQTAGVGTYRFTIHAWQTPQVEGDPASYRTFTEAVVVFGRGMYVSTRVEGGAYQESLLLEGKEYTRARPDGEWQGRETTFDPSAIPTLDPQRHFQLVDDLVQPRIVGDEVVDEVRLTKVIGRVDMELKAQRIWGDLDTKSVEFREGAAEPRSQFLAGSEEFTGWVGVDDSLFRAYELSGTFPGFGTLLPFEYWYRVEFSDFDQALELPSPAP